MPGQEEIKKTESKRTASSPELTQEDIQRLIKKPFDKKIDITKKIAEGKPCLKQ